MTQWNKSTLTQKVLGEGTHQNPNSTDFLLKRVLNTNEGRQVTLIHHCLSTPLQSFSEVGKEREET